LDSALTLQSQKVDTCNFDSFSNGPILTKSKRNSHGNDFDIDSNCKANHTCNCEESRRWFCFFWATSDRRSHSNDKRVCKCNLGLFLQRHINTVKPSYSKQITAFYFANQRSRLPKTMHFPSLPSRENW
jgi:hypothetical protein